MEMKRSLFICSLLLAVAGCGQCKESVSVLPNFVVIFCDDLGYGDVGAFGHPTIRTPELDRMAAEGQKWTSFYVGASVCTPSRAALLTGRLPIRSGMCSDRRRVLFPDSGGGLPETEITIAEALRDLGYSTGCVGKWHLGHLPQYLPTENGFDSYFGIPYSNDMDRVPESPDGRAAFLNPAIESWNVPLLRNTEIVERPADQRTITRRYTDEAVQFIQANRERPFFLYLAHSMPHVPLFRSESFAGSSLRGLFGDVIEEIDWSVGQVLQTLRDLQLDRNTLVVFTSDNGPWLSYDQQGGSAGLLRGGKGGTFEGGMREPTIFWWPGTAEPGVKPGLATTMDILPTFLELAGSSVPGDRIIDGYSLAAVLRSEAVSPRQKVLYYRGTEIYAARKGPFKAHFITRSEYGGEDPVHHDPPLLYQLEHDPSEQFDLAEKHPEVIAEISAFVEEHKASVIPVPDQLAIRIEQ
jgi:arylsulfatase A-like enzyme